MVTIKNADVTKAFLSLRQSQQSVNDSLARIASGKRITKAADDASSLAIADSLESQYRGLDQAVRNVVDGVAMAQVADAALEQSGELVMGMRVKALQAANASQSPASRQALQADIETSLRALNTIASTTSYNGQKLLSGEFSQKAIQAGTASGETIDLTIPSAAPDTLGGDGGMLSDIDLTTQEGAETALAITDAALGAIEDIRGSLGATSNQLTSSMKNLLQSKVNIASSRSQIDDLDFYEESITLKKMQLLERAAVFAAGQTGKLNRRSIEDLLQG